MSYSLLIPVFNEERTIPLLINKLKTLDDQIEIIIINDGSNDKTNSLLINIDNDFIIIHNDANKGKGYAIKKGIARALNQNIIIMDGDLEIEVDDIPMLIKIYEQNNYEPLVGIRWSKNNDYSNLHTIGNYFINWIFNLLYRSNFRDVLCCTKIIKKELLQSLSLKSNGFSIETEIMIKLSLKNYAITEQKIRYSRRTVKEGKKLRLFDSWSIIWTIIKYKFPNSSE